MAPFGSPIFWNAGWKNAMSPTSKDACGVWSQRKPCSVAYPSFNPIVYSVENVLPSVKLGQDEKWAPNPTQPATHWWTSYGFLAGFPWFLILAGWV